MQSTMMEPHQPDGRQPLLAAQGITRYFGADGRHILVLDNINLTLRAGELVALLGPSGSGKSTLLRIFAGLLPPSDGQVLVDGRPLHGPNPQVAVVFQSFALYPWLTVFQNVGLGLLARELPAAERTRRTLAAIDLVGLDGFESAYPKEISGGMRQRVGFARALVVEPEVLLMDEPFSALDVLTAENLRRDFQELWLERRIPIRAILIVTHNIDEAVSLADRLVIMATDPGTIRVELPGLPLAERRRKGQQRADLVDTIYRILTSPYEDVSRLVPGAHPARPPLAPRPYQTLPHVTIGDLTGFIERLAEAGGREDLYKLAEDLQSRAKDLLPLAEAADLLGFADIQAGDAVLTEPGHRLASADQQTEKDLFRQHALAGIRLLQEIEAELRDSPRHRLSESRFLEDLEQTFSPAEARRQLDTAIDWGRYAELFAYNDIDGEFYLEPDTA